MSSQICSLPENSGLVFVIDIYDNKTLTGMRNSTFPSLSCISMVESGLICVVNHSYSFRALRTTSALVGASSLSCIVSSRLSASAEKSNCTRCLVFGFAVFIFFFRRMSAASIVESQDHIKRCRNERWRNEKQNITSY
jgi:hypothetical protein